MKLKPMAVAFLVVSMVSAAQPTMAQERVIDRAAIEQALVERVQDDGASRASIKSLLARSEVRRMAGDLSLDLRRAETAVATLQGPELERVAQQATAANELLSGGAQTIRISVVTLLLIIIIVILLAD